eukprot:scaffold39826_cov46-Prasinocladus_malaysianus.AAC.1
MSGSQGLRYIRDFISKEEELALVAFINVHPLERWVQASGRRMLNWGGKPGDREIKEALPACIQALVDRM